MKKALLKLYYNLPYKPKAKIYSIKGAKNNRIPVSDTTYLLIRKILPEHVTTLSFDRGNSIKFISKECYEYMLDNIKEYKKLLLATDVITDLDTLKLIIGTETIVNEQQAIEVAELFE